ncbi:hypothetical protein Tco_1266384 [Tanacetum coccineum]
MTLSISIDFEDEDDEGLRDDSVLVSKDNSVDEDCNVCEDAYAGLSKDEIVNDKLVDEDCNVCEDAFVGLSKDNAVNEKSVGNNDQLLLEDGDGIFDSEAGCRNSKEDNENQSANVSIRDLYAVIKVHVPNVHPNTPLVIKLLHVQVTVERNELQDETSTLQNQISELKSMIKERTVQTNLDLNAPAIETQEPQLPQYFPHDIIRLPSGDPVLNPIFVVPTCHNVQINPQPVSNVSKPNPRYPTPSDSWPFQLLERPSQEVGEIQHRERV